LTLCYIKKGFLTWQEYPPGARTRYCAHIIKSGQSKAVFRRMDAWRWVDFPSPPLPQHPSTSKGTASRAPYHEGGAGPPAKTGLETEPTKTGAGKIHGSGFPGGVAYSLPPEGAELGTIPERIEVWRRRSLCPHTETHGICPLPCRDHGPGEHVSAGRPGYGFQFFQLSGNLEVTVIDQYRLYDPILLKHQEGLVVRQHFRLIGREEGHMDWNGFSIP